jgi:hypothetical protein
MGKYNMIYGIRAEAEMGIHGIGVVPKPLKHSAVEQNTLTIVKFYKMF